MKRPLADEIRPKTLDEVVGQRHLLAPGAVLRRLIESGTDVNMVFTVPPAPERRPLPTSLPSRPIRPSTGSTPPQPRCRTSRIASRM